METRKLRLAFPINLVGTPVFYQFAAVYDIQPNVLAADIAPATGGWMLVSVTGLKDKIDEAVAWASSRGVSVSAA